MNSELATSTQAVKVNQKHISRWRLVTVLLALVLAWETVAWLGARLLVTQRELPRADAILVLSGSANYAERVELAAELFTQKRASRVVLTNDDVRSGWSQKEQRNPLFVERAKEQLRRAGIPEDKIEVLPGVVNGTYDEALRAREYAAAHNIRSLLLVTSAYHSRRALWTFGRVLHDTGAQVGLIAVRAGKQSPSAATWWLSLNGWRMVAGEYVKLVYYWFQY